MMITSDNFRYKVKIKLVHTNGFRKKQREKE